MALIGIVIGHPDTPSGVTPQSAALLPYGVSKGFTPTSYFGGGLSISGTVTISSVPGQKRVTLFERGLMRPVTQVQSDPVTGAFSFDNLRDTSVFFIVGFDDTLVYNSETADNLIAE